MARAAPAATRAASILAFLTANPTRGFRISELAEHLGMNLASAHATLAVLCDAGFLLRDPVHRTYVLGPALAVTGFAALEEHPAIGAAIEQAELLAD
jgi:DNA-binding IclR family transcriptional regulator